MSSHLWVPNAQLTETVGVVVCVHCFLWFLGGPGHVPDIVLATQGVSICAACLFSLPFPSLAGPSPAFSSRFCVSHVPGSCSPWDSCLQTERVAPWRPRFLLSWDTCASHLVLLLFVPGLFPAVRWLPHGGHLLRSWRSPHGHLGLLGNVSRARWPPRSSLEAGPGPARRISPPGSGQPAPPPGVLRARGFLGRSPSSSRAQLDS